MLENLEKHRPKRGRKSQPCRLKQLMATLDENDRRILDDAIADTYTWTSRGLWTALVAKGVDISYMAIYNHRSALCQCARA